MSSSHNDINSALDFVKQHTSPDSLVECSRCCAMMNRDYPNNARDFFDSFLVKLMNDRRWPRDVPIQLVDTSAGRLLQMATIVTSLVKAGYKVNAIAIDVAYEKLSETKKLNDPKYQIPIDNFKKLIETLNAEAGKEVATLNIFSHIDSYLAAVEGMAPPQYKRVSLEERSKAIREGAKARYINLDVKGDNKLLNIESRANRAFVREFSAGIANGITKKTPDVIVTIDDIGNFAPRWQIKTDQVTNSGLSEKELIADTLPRGDEFAYENEVVEPIQKINSDAIILGTLKDRNLYQLIHHGQRVRETPSAFSLAVAKVMSPLQSSAIKATFKSDSVDVVEIAVNVVIKHFSLLESFRSESSSSSSSSSSIASKENNIGFFDSLTKNDLSDQLVGGYAEKLISSNNCLERATIIYAILMHQNAQGLAAEIAMAIDNSGGYDSKVLKRNIQNAKTEFLNVISKVLPSAQKGVEKNMDKLAKIINGSHQINIASEIQKLFPEANSHNMRL